MQYIEKINELLKNKKSVLWRKILVGYKDINGEIHEGIIRLTFFKKK